MSLLESKGWLRTIGAGIASIGQLLATVPIAHIRAWSEMVTQLGAIIGGIGVVRAAVSGTLFSLKKDKL